MEFNGENVEFRELSGGQPLCEPCWGTIGIGNNINSFCLEAVLF